MSKQNENVVFVVTVVCDGFDVTVVGLCCEKGFVVDGETARRGLDETPPRCFLSRTTVRRVGNGSRDNDDDDDDDDCCCSSCGSSHHMIVQVRDTNDRLIVNNRKKH